MSLGPLSRRALVSSMLATFPFAARQVRADSAYPARPVRIIVPFPPGGLFDTVGRPLADKLRNRLGTVSIDNIGRASSARGATVASRAVPDGYMLVHGGNNSQVVAPLAASKLGYDPLADSEPISLIGRTPFAYGVHSALPVKALPELIAYAMAKPDTLSFGSAGTGSLTHLTGELLLQRSGPSGVVQVPYSEGGPVINALVAGQVPMAVLTISG